MMHGFSSGKYRLWQEARMSHFVLEQQPPPEVPRPEGPEARTNAFLQGVLRFLQGISGATGQQAVGRALERRTPEVPDADVPTQFVSTSPDTDVFIPATFDAADVPTVMPSTRPVRPVSRVRTPRVVPVPTETPTTPPATTETPVTPPATTETPVTPPATTETPTTPPAVPTPTEVPETPVAVNIPSSPVLERPRLREEVETVDTHTRQEVLNETRYLYSEPKVVYQSQLDDKVEGDYGPILEGIARFRTVVSELSADEQAALRENCYLNILPKGALHSINGADIGIDVTQPANHIRELLSRELRPVIFVRDVQGKLRTAGVSFRHVMPSRLNVQDLNAQAVSDKIAGAIGRVPDAARRTMDLRWLYITNGDRQHSLNSGNIYTVNINESEAHIAAFLIRMLAGADADASIETVNANLREKQALIDDIASLRGDRIVSSLSTLSSSVVRDFTDIRAGVTRFRTMRDGLSNPEQQALADCTLTVQPKGTAAIFRAGDLELDLTQDIGIIRTALQQELARVIYAKEVKDALQTRLGITLLGVYARNTIPEKTPQEAVAIVADAVDALPAQSRDIFRATISSLYLANGAADTAGASSNNTILTVNITKAVPEITAALTSIYRPTGIDHLYDRVPEGTNVDLNRDMTAWVARQRAFRDRRTTPPVLRQNFPAEYASQLRNVAGVTVANAGGSGPVDLTFATAITYGSTSEREWSLASDVMLNSDGKADEVYLYPKGKPTEGILLQCSVLFSQDGSLDPVRLRRFATLALEHNASEREDPAQIRNFDIAERSDKIACINLVDDTSALTRGLGHSAESFSTLLNGHYARKYGADANRMTSRTIAVGARDNPLTALTENVNTAVAAGRTVIVINLAAHGDSNAANYGAGDLRAVDVLALMQRHPTVRFTLFAPNCFGAGFEDAMRSLRDPSGAVGRITVFHQAKQDSTNVAFRSGETDPYTTAYDAALHALIADPANASRSFGDMHMEADRIARTRSLRNAGVWRSGGSGPSTRTARLEGGRRDPAV